MCKKPTATPFRLFFLKSATNFILQAVFLLLEEMVNCQYVVTEESLLCTRKKRNPSSFSAAWLIYQWNKHPKGEGGFTVALYIDLQLYQRLFLERKGGLVKHTFCG